MEKLQILFDTKLRQTTASMKRYMYKRINWNNRLIGLVGPRGVGKTTLLIQRIKDCINDNLAEHWERHEVLYTAADNLYFTQNTLFDLAMAFAQQGGKYLFLDEIHKYKEWSRELKLIYDNLPELHIVFSGSSILDITKGAHDLSRRVVMYHMQGLSFREYLLMFHHIEMPVYNIDDILQHKVTFTSNFKPLMYFKMYLQEGYYPFALEEQNLAERLNQVIDTSIFVDIPQYAELTASVAKKLHKLLAIIAESVPFKPNMQSLSQALQVSRNDVASYCDYIDQVGLIAQLQTNTSGVRGLGKVSKIYLDNTTLMYALVGQGAEIGNIRETFFYNQTRVVANPTDPGFTDFQIEDYFFEVGGKQKKRKQLADVEKGFVVKDDIESGYGNILPLWYFGLLY